MPIVDIELVARDDLAPLDAALTRRLADALGEAFGAAPGKVWVRLRSLPAAQYAENAAEAPAPAFVRITASVPPEGDALRRLVAEITGIVARLCSRPPGNVHVEFAPAARGRIAFGGRLVE